MTIVRAKHIKLTNADQISFKKYRPPPNIDRGLCLQCKKPVVEFGGFAALKWAFIPASNFDYSSVVAYAAKASILRQTCEGYFG